ATCADVRPLLFVPKNRWPQPLADPSMFKTSVFHRWLLLSSNFRMLRLSSAISGGNDVGPSLKARAPSCWLLFSTQRYPAREKLPGLFILHELVPRQRKSEQPPTEMFGACKTPSYSQ